MSDDALKKHYKPKFVGPPRRAEADIVSCQKCGNENLIHNLPFGKAYADAAGGPSTQMKMQVPYWLVYVCPQCNSFFPYQRYYPVKPELTQMHKQIVVWFEELNKFRVDAQAVAEKINSVLEASSDLNSLDSQVIEAALVPLWEEINNLKTANKVGKGGRPRNCKNNRKGVANKCTGKVPAGSDREYCDVSEKVGYGKKDQ